MEGQLGVLIGDVDKHIQRIGRDRNRNRFASAAIRLAAILLSTTVTIVLGVKGYIPQYSDVLSVIALVASATLTALTGWESFSDHGGRWIRKKTMLGQLLNLRDDLNFALAGSQELSEQQTIDFRKRLTDCVEEEQRLWITQRAKSIASPLVSNGAR